MPLDKFENIEVRCTLAKMIVRLFRLWEISLEDKLSLLGLDNSDRKLLGDFGRGSPLPETEEMLKRATMLLEIHKNLHMLFPENRNLAYSWVKTYNQRFGHPPLEIMKSGLQGLASVYKYLDSV